MTLGEQLRKERRNRNIPSKTMAAMLDLSKETLWRIENDKNDSISMDHLKRYADAFDCTFEIKITFAPKLEL